MNSQKYVYDYDVIVIGSGFGGSVMTCRLTEKGYKVCLLERGREYKYNDFPRRMNEIKDRFVWDPEDKKYGFIEFRDYPNSDAMSVAAAGLGGGSLIYANVLMKMPAEFFKNWPHPLSREVLDPYYEVVLNMMEASPYPFDENHPFYHNTIKTRRLKEAIDRILLSSKANSTHQETQQHISNIEKKTLNMNDNFPIEGMSGNPTFFLPHLAVRFKGKFPGEQTLNQHGALQSSCTKCGECDIGCNIHAKNTLDLNYLQRARTFTQKAAGPATIITNAEVIEIRPLDENGYEVDYKNPINPSNKITLKAKKVVLSAGAIRSTELLLKMKKKNKLKNMSPLLGKKLCGNGDLIGFGLQCDDPIEPTLGPVITGAVHFPFEPYTDDFPHGLFIEDAGYPIGWSWYLTGKIGSKDSWLGIIKMSYRMIRSYIKRLFRFKEKNFEINIGDDIADLIDNDHFIRNSFMLLGMGRDRSDGEIILGENNEPIIKWNREKSELHIQRAQKSMKAIVHSLGGIFVNNPLTNADKIITVHPLGGCPMGTHPEEGVVNTRGEVFGHPNLYVVDASIMPTSLGSNPSLTIAALAEFIADQFENIVN